MSRAQTTALLMVELTGRYEALAAEAAELQLPAHHNLGRLAVLRDETRAALCLIDAMLVLRHVAQLGPEWLSE